VVSFDGYMYVVRPGHRQGRSGPRLCFSGMAAAKAHSHLRLHVGDGCAQLFHTAWLSSSDRRAMGLTDPALKASSMPRFRAARRRGSKNILISYKNKQRLAQMGMYICTRWRKRGTRLLHSSSISSASSIDLFRCLSSPS
jgi:hypothetical protein